MVQSPGPGSPAGPPFPADRPPTQPISKTHSFRVSLAGLRLRLFFLSILVLIPSWALLFLRLGMNDRPGTPWYATHLFFFEAAGVVTLVLIYVGCRFLVVRRLDTVMRAALSEGARVSQELNKAQHSLAQTTLRLDREETRLRIFEDQYRMVVEEVPAVFYLAKDDLHGSRAFVSRQVDRYFGYSPAEWTGDPAIWSKRLHPADRGRVLTEFARCLATGEAFDVEYRFFHHDGRELWVRDIGGPVLPPSPEAGMMRGFILDITDRKRVEDALREERNFAAKVLDTAGVLVVVLDLEGRIIRFNKACEKLSGYGFAEVQDKAFWDLLVAPEELDKVRTDFAELRAGKTSPPHFDSFFVGKDKTRHRVAWSNVAVRDESNRVTQILATGVDITESRQLQERLKHDALHDTLTGLPNRALFVDRLRQCLKRSERRRDRFFAVLFLDLDRFKNVNDSMGHLLGDKLLIETARRLETCVRPGDTVARLGGDEFTVLLEDVKDAADAIHVSGRIQELWKVPITLGGQDVYATASIGIAVSKQEYTRPEEILRDADTAMYRAKTLGRARFEVFDAAMHAHTVALLQVETDLRRALERGELVVYYQPIVALEDQSLSGFEALVRWNHPTRGLVPPMEFVRVAEETGLIVAVDRFVLREACRQLREWNRTFRNGTPLTMSVNLSVKQFNQADLFDTILGTLEETGLASQCLSLEITESVLLEGTDSAVEVLASLKEVGARLYLDDFGTGYSSLSYLHKFPVDALKVDRSFVREMGGGGQGQEIIRTIVALAKSLNMKVIAEGVETQEQAAALQALDCDYGQGHVFSKPLSGKEVGELLAKGAASL